MNISFWGSMMLMLFVAISIIVWPLLKQRRTLSLAYKDSNLGLYQEKLQELETDLTEGRIEQGFYNNAREELDRELLADIPEENRDNSAQHYAVLTERKPALALFVAAFISAVSLLVYLQIGMHAESESFQQQVEQPQKQMSVAEMTTVLEERLQQQGGDATAWSMLGRAYKHLGRYSDAASAFGIALEQSESTQLMLELAESIALANDQQFDKKARELVLRVLDIEPNNANALWFAGVAEFQFEQYWKSVDHLARLTEIAGQDDQVKQSVKHYLTEIRSKLSADGEDVQPIDEVLQLVGKSSVATQQTDNITVTHIIVNVDVAADIKAKYDADTTVFVYAKAQSGPKMPLAVQRMRLSDLPATVGLDDSMAMVDGMNLSTFNNVVVSARISRSGSALSQSGDYIGSIAVNDVSQTPSVNIVIQSIVP